MEFSERDKRLWNAIKDSWQHTDLSLRFIIVGFLLIMLSLMGYGIKYFKEGGIL